MSEQRVLVTGGAGYIGSVLVGALLDAGYAVRVLDRFYFGNTLDHLRHDHRLETVRGDIRSIDPAIMNDVWAVADLAAISNDPAGELDPAKTLEINHQGRARIARIAKAAGVKRYVLASSCSVYGFQQDIITEGSQTNPLTTYAEANLLAERDTLRLADGPMTVTVLRQATVYGPSPRMRFDLAVNGMTLGLWKNGSIPILRDGNQWRPMLHVVDAARAFIAVFKADASAVDGEIFNVGSNSQNYQILDLARRVAAGIGVPFEYDWYGSPDRRSYRVNFDKFSSRLGYSVTETPESAAAAIAERLRHGTITTDARSRTVEWYSSLLQWRATINDLLIDDELL